jgi:hypothetical protein
MSSSRRGLDSNEHQFGCPLLGEVPAAEPDGVHVDLFCECHNWGKPKLLANGTYLAWPAGRTESPVPGWRAKNALAAPTSV